jgi:hypothetical protein
MMELSIFLYQSTGYLPSKHILGNRHRHPRRGEDVPPDGTDGIQGRIPMLQQT